MELTVYLLFLAENIILLVRYRRIFRRILAYVTKGKKSGKNIKFEDIDGAWYTVPSTVILHGAGGRNGARYNNSKESILRGIELGYRVIEIDIGETRDGKYVLTHRFRPDDETVFTEKPYELEFLNGGAIEGETALNLEMFVSLFLNDSQYYLIDCAHGIELKVCRWFEENATSLQRKNIIFQVSDIVTLKHVFEMNVFENIHYNSSTKDIFENLIQLERYGVHSCSVDESEIVPQNHYYQKIIDTGMNIYAYTVNQKRRWRYLIDVGVKGCFSDFLIEKNILE